MPVLIGADEYGDKDVLAVGKEAEAALGLVAEAYGVPCERAVERLAGDQDELSCFHDFPCEHWKHIPAANGPP